jgi:hypothetical protein
VWLSDCGLSGGETIAGDEWKVLEEWPGGKYVV